MPNMPNSIREIAPAPLGVIVLSIGAIGLAGCGGGSGNSVPTAANPADTAATVDADCAQTPIALNQYAQNGPNIMQPISAKLINGAWAFNPKATPDTIADEVAEQVGSNTAALAVIYTIEDGVATNHPPVDPPTTATQNFELLENNSATREADCKIIVSEILGAPEVFDYNSGSDSIWTYGPPVADGQNTWQLSGSVGPAGSTPAFNIAPVYGTANYGLQKSTAEDWGITPQGQIQESVQVNKNVQPSKSGQPVKTTAHGQVPSQSSNPNNITSPLTGGSTGSGAGAGPNRQSRPGTAEHGPGISKTPEGRPQKKHNTPSGGGSGGSGSGEAPVTTTPVTTTPTGTTPNTTPNTTPTSTTPTETTPTTTTPTTTVPTTTTPTTTTPTTTTPITKPGSPGQSGA